MKHVLTLTITAAIIPTCVGAYYWTVDRFKCRMSPPESPFYPTYPTFGTFGRIAEYAFAPIHELDRCARSDHWNMVSQGDESVSVPDRIEP